MRVIKKDPGLQLIWVVTLDKGDVPREYLQFSCNDKSVESNQVNGSPAELEFQTPLVSYDLSGGADNLIKIKLMHMYPSELKVKKISLYMD